MHLIYAYHGREEEKQIGNSKCSKWVGEGKGYQIGYWDTRPSCEKLHRLVYNRACSTCVLVTIAVAIGYSYILVRV